MKKHRHQWSKWQFESGAWWRWCEKTGVWCGEGQRRYSRPKKRFSRSKN